MLTAVFLWTFSTICGTLLMVQIVEYFFQLFIFIFQFSSKFIKEIDFIFIQKFFFEQSSGNVVQLMSALVLLFWSFLVILLLCNFGEQVSSEFELIYNDVYDCDWYTFPIEIQRMVLLIMVSSEKPAVFQGFGNFLLKRETSKMVNFS